MWLHTVVQLTTSSTVPNGTSSGKLVVYESLLNWGILSFTSVMFTVTLAIVCRGRYTMNTMISYSVS